MDSSEKINQKRLKRFTKHLCLIAKRHKERENAHDELHTQIKKLKKFAHNKKKIDEELKELDKKISLVLEKEAELIGIKQIQSTASEQLMNKVMENRERVNQINQSINEIKKMLENYFKSKTEREKMVNELEKKIRAKFEQKKNIPLLKNRLIGLEALYNKLKKKGIDVSKVENRINDLKLRLSFARL